MSRASCDSLGQLRRLHGQRNGMATSTSGIFGQASVRGAVGWARGGGQAAASPLDHSIMQHSQKNNKGLFSHSAGPKMRKNARSARRVQPFHWGRHPPGVGQPSSAARAGCTNLGQEVHDLDSSFSHAAVRFRHSFPNHDPWQDRVQAGGRRVQLHGVPAANCVQRTRAAETVPSLGTLLASSATRSWL
jgi:hypothetical protein